MNLAELFIRVNADISGIQKNMTAVQRSLDKTADRASALGQKLTLGITVPLTALAGLSLKAAADFDSLRRGLEAVAGSAGAAEQQIARLREIAKLPAVDLNQAAQASIAFQAIGKSAEFAERTIKGVANAVALSGGGSQEFSGVLRQLRQVASLGKLMGEELNVILENAPAMAKALQNAFGTTSADAIRKLNLTTEEFFERLQKGMESLPQVSGGAANSFDNLRQSLQQAAAVVGGQLLPSVIPLVDGFTRMLEGMQALNPETLRLGIAFGVTAAALGPLLSGLAAATKAFITLQAVSKATLLTVGVGGALAVGLAALAGLFVKTKLEAAAAASEVKGFSREIAELSEQTARFRLNDLTEQILDLNEELRGLSEFETVTDVVDGVTYTFQRLNPEFAATRAELDGLNERWRLLVRRVGDLQNPAEAVANAILTIPESAEDAAKRLEKAVDRMLESMLRARRFIRDGGGLDDQGRPDGSSRTIGFRPDIGAGTINRDAFLRFRDSLPTPDLTPVTARGEKTASQAVEIEAVALAREAERQAIDNLLVAIGSVSRATARGVQGLQSFLASIELFKKGQGGSGLAGALNLAAGAIGGLSAAGQIGGAMLQLGQHLFGQTQATRELIAAMRSNSDRLRDLRLQASGFSVNPETVAAARAAAESIAGVQYGGLTLFGGNAENDIRNLNDYVKQFNLTGDEFLKVMKEAGIQILDSTGNVMYPAFKQAAEILGLWTDEVEKATSSMSNVPVVFANALRRFQASTAGVSGSGAGTRGTALPVGGAPGRDRPTIDISGPVTIVANDPESFARQMEGYGQKVLMRAGYSTFALAGT